MDPFEKFRQKFRESSHENDYVKAEENTAENEEETPNSAVEKQDELEYVFFPRPEITVYDLARILAITQLSISEDVYQKFPPDLQKFFAKFQDLSQSEII